MRIEIEIFHTPSAGGHIYTQFNVMCVSSISPLQLANDEIHHPSFPHRYGYPGSDAQAGPPSHPVWVGRHH